MQYIIGGGVILALLYGGLRLIVASDPRSLARLIRYILGAILILLGGVLAFSGRVGLGLALVGLGAAALLTGRLGWLDLRGRQDKRVRGRFVEMTLDEDGRGLTGRVLAGTFAGRSLDDLDESELRALLREAVVDPDSAALVEAYLDRRFPLWREDGETDAGTGAGGAPDPGAMTDEQAYEVLGLAPGAGEAEIRAAHRRLLKGVHPDRGGSTFLASRINLAKDRLLSRHRSNS